MNIDWTNAIVGALLGALVTGVLSVFLLLFQDSITDFFVDLLGDMISFRPTQRIDGTWDQNWQVDNYAEIVVHDDSTLIIKQLNKRITGTFRFENRNYRLRGKMELDNFINGVWFDAKEGAVYHGVFQARIETNAQEINGKWVGFSRRLNRIRTGNWHWKRRD